MCSVVVAGAAQVGVVVRQQGQVLLGQRQVFQPLAQDRFEALVAARAEADGATAGQLQTRLTVGFTQAQDAQAGPVALLRMDAPFEDAAFCKVVVASAVFLSCYFHCRLLPLWVECDGADRLPISRCT